MRGWVQSRRAKWGIGAALAGAVAALMLAGCSGSMMADHLPTAVGGEPSGVPDRPMTEQAYPAVHNMPPQRSTVTLSEAQQKQLENDLITVRNRAAGDSASTTGTAGNTSAAAPDKP